jgi:hypothetical protein
MGLLKYAGARTSLPTDVISKIVSPVSLSLDLTSGYLEDNDSPTVW